MTNTHEATTLLKEAKEKYDNGLDPSYQIEQAIKAVERASEDVSMWRNKYLAKLTEPVKA